MALILCIETGTDICSVALARNGELISLRESGEGKNHAQNLAVYVEEILHENDIDAKNLDAIAVGKGPGSYTGLRIGVSLAKGLCYAASIPLIGVNSLESMVNVALEDNEAGIIDIGNLEKAILCPMIDARRMEVYCQTFDSKAEPLSEVGAVVVESESFAKERTQGELILFGNGAKKCKDVLTGDDEALVGGNIKYVEVVPSARGIVKPAFKKLGMSDFEDVAYFEPFYLKDFVATTSQKKIF